MSREIKFKAFHDGVMYDLLAIDWEWDSAVLYNPTTDMEYEYSPKVITLLQYTGLKDNNCNEVYDGYILKPFIFTHYNIDVLVVRWIDKCGCFGLTFTDTKTGESDYFDLSIANRCEIVGNKFENHELL